jgi:polygalacturonase
LGLVSGGLAQPPNSYDIKKRFGAIGDGVVMDTGAISKAIESASNAGGGTVYFPASKYLTGPVSLKSNITLWLDAGATILGNKNLADYGTGRGMPLISASEVHNVGIMGRGTIGLR